MAEQRPPHAPTEPACTDCGVPAEFEIVETFMGLDVLGPGTPVCKACGDARLDPEQQAKETTR